MKHATLLRTTAATLALSTVLSPALAGEITAFEGVYGDGTIFFDPNEGVSAPGIKAITGAINNDDFTSANGFSPQGSVNCVMASNANPCDATPGTGKRWKSWLQGAAGFDMQFLTSATGGTTEYFNFGKMTNFSTARVAGVTLTIGTGTGDDFTPVAAGGADGVSFDNLVAASAKAGEWPTVTAGDLDQNPLQRIFFPGGLFGDGGQEGVIGFFSADEAGFAVDPSADLTQLTTGTFFNADHVALFGDGLLDRTRLPDAMFWDSDGDDTTEAHLVAWYNTGAGEWQYGNLADDPATVGVDEAADFLQELADELGVTVAELGHTQTQGTTVPANIVALLEARDSVTVGGIEDISNLNLNFSVDVADIPAGAFTIRVTPSFFPIVALANSEYQFAVANTLDTANIPYLGADAGYVTTINNILALGSTADQRTALERIGYSFIGAHRNLEYEMGTQTIGNVRYGSTMANGTAFGGASFSTKDGDTIIPDNAGARWTLGNGLQAFVSASGSLGSMADTTNSAGYTFRGLGAAAGISAQLGDMFEAGLALSYNRVNATINDNRGLSIRQYRQHPPHQRGWHQRHGNRHQSGLRSLCGRVGRLPVRYGQPVHRSVRVA